LLRGCACKMPVNASKSAMVHSFFKTWLCCLLMYTQDTCQGFVCAVLRH
jgi:hypothetical protein